MPFKHMFGDSCNVPIIEVSQYVDADANIAIGQALKALRSEGIVILSGGLTIHTFEDFAAFSPGRAKQGYKDFESKLKQILQIGESQSRNFQLKAILSDPWFKRAHPTIEHFTPMYIAAGAGDDGKSKILSDLHGAITVAFDT